MERAGSKKKIRRGRWMAGLVALNLLTQGLEGKDEGVKGGKILVKLKTGVERGKWERERKGDKKQKIIAECLREKSLLIIKLGEGQDLNQALRDYQRDGGVEFAEPDYPIHAATVPNDPAFTKGVQWGLQNLGGKGGLIGADIGAVMGWDTLREAGDVIVAVVDSGVRYTHEDLRENAWVNRGEIAGNGIDDDGNGVIDDVYGFNAIEDTGDPMDDLGHGTHLAGIIAARGNNGKGITGVAWKAQVMACKFLGKDGYGQTADAIQCIEYARRNGAQIINASWGLEEESKALKMAIKEAGEAGIIFVTAAGNERGDNDRTPVWPGNFELDNIVVVCSTSRNDLFQGSFSNHGARTVDIAAPGVSIYSTWWTSDESYFTQDGTSMSAAYVSGICAMLKERYPGETGQQLIERLYSSGDILEGLRGKCATGRRVNLSKAMGPPLEAKFRAQAGGDGLTFTFLNDSVGPIINYTWDFGDGTAVSGEENESHTFPRDGIYDVRLTLNGIGGQSSTWTERVKAILPGQLFDVGKTMEGRFAFRMRGNQGGIYVVESSENLNQWVERAILKVSATREATFEEEEGEGKMARFYRVRRMEGAEKEERD